MEPALKKARLNIERAGLFAKRKPRWIQRYRLYVFAICIIAYDGQDIGREALAVMRKVGVVKTLRLPVLDGVRLPIASYL